MKKLLMMLPLWLAVCSTGAQEIWEATQITDLTVGEQTIEATENMTLTIASILNEKDIQDGKSPWLLDATANIALNTDLCTPKFTACLKGMGNPYVEDAGGHWETNSSGDQVWREDANAVRWTPGCGKLPLHGMYLKLAPKVSGTLRMGVYINKGNHPLYIVEENSVAELPYGDIAVEFYYQNNGFTFDDNGQTVSMVKGTMPADYIIQHTNGYTQNRPVLGYITFDVEGGKTYYVFNPSSQVGLYGYYFTTGSESTEVTATLSVSPTDAGTVSPTTTTILKGTSFTATATANAGYAFEGWYIGDELVATDNPHTFTLTADANITARFTAQAANTVMGFVKTGCENMGTVSVSPVGTPANGGVKFNYGTTVTLTATAAKGFRFDHWEDGDGQMLSTSEKYSFTVTDNCEVWAVFKGLENYVADLISFPGCEGYGRFTTGGRAIDGRGSKVYYVTRLDDSDEEGTLRWAVTTGDDTPRTVLFKVGGTIYLTSRLSAKGNITIAGQTAPGGGICIAGYQMKLGSNSIVRHIRFRTGDLPNGSMSPLDVENINHVVLDHCSFSWSMEENLTLYDTDYTTTQWCIFSEGLYYSKNVKGQRSYAMQWGGEHGTLHHCLISNCNSRMPRFNGVRMSVNDRHVDNEFVNNVIFNWGGHNSIYGGERDAATGDDSYNRVYMINNYYRPGPLTKKNGGNRHFVSASAEKAEDLGEWYLKGNKFELNSKWAPATTIWSNAELEKVNADNYYGFVGGNNSRGMNLYRAGSQIPLTQEIADKILLKELPYPLSGMSHDESADEAYRKVVAQAGASLPRYDEVDERLLAEAAGQRDPQFGGSLGKYGIIDTPYDIELQEHDDFVALDEATGQEINVTCYPRLQMDATDCRVVDSDGDGLPDDYEDEAGLDKNNASDGQQLTENGYSNLELFINAVADGTIDMTRYTKRQPQSAGFAGFDAIVDANFTDISPVGGNGIATYSTIQAAIDAAPGTAPYYIFIKKGTYEGHVQIDKPNVHLTGQSKQNTIITWNRLHNEAGGNVNTNATMNVTAHDVSLDNLTIRNTRQAEGQALALYTKADRVSITSCNLEGWQDTYRTGTRGQRHIVRNSKISGTTDFIYNDGEVFFDSDTLHVLRPSNVITAPAHQSAKYGYVFHDCVITAAAVGAATYLGRPWTDSPKVSFINTRLAAGVTIPAEGWQDMGAYPVQMAEYNTMDSEGNAVDLSHRKKAFTVDGTTKDCSKAVLTPLETEGYKLDYMLRGSDEWDADWTAFILPAPEMTVGDGELRWTDHTGLATRFLVVADGEARLTTDTACEYSEGQTVTVQAISAYGVLGDAVSAADASSSGVNAVKGGQHVVIRQFFDAEGRQLPRLRHGLNIIRETHVDGSVTDSKVMVR
ncbi:MAG: hypothetical protein IJ200_07010 [Prevotella sp.]|nr:hypothetical protein [Prevotella sp.]